VKRKLVTGLLVVPIAVTFAFATSDTKDDLIALDKEWGVANLKADTAALDKIYSDDMIAVTPQGMLTKAQMLENLTPADSTDYKTSDYSVQMIGDDRAIMAHQGDGYRSLHVFEKRGSTWVVIATATVPDAPE
jgi:hypothetical protein